MAYRAPLNDEDLCAAAEISLKQVRLNIHLFQEDRIRPEAMATAFYSKSNRMTTGVLGAEVFSFSSERPENKVQRPAPCSCKEPTSEEQRVLPLFSEEEAV